jgi:hypothetical protein
MTKATLPQNSLAGDTVPAAVEELCLMQDRNCERLRARVDSISSELSGDLDREERLELAAAIADVADELSVLVQQKVGAGYFDGFAGTTQHVQERVAHLQADYRRLLNELRTARHEVAAGKPRKARQQMASWLGHFNDLVGRESDLISELWSV